jgi:hypothetical protein
MPTLFRRTIHGEYTERTDNIATAKRKGKAKTMSTSQLIEEFNLESE